MSSVLLLLIAFISKVYTIPIYNSWTISPGSTYDSYKFNVLHHLTAISPYFQYNSEELSPDSSEGCRVDKTVYQICHGSVYVNDNDYELTIEPFLQLLKNAADSVDFSNAEDLAFLTHWTSHITNSEQQVAKLSKFGYLEAFSAGIRLSCRYPDLMPVTKNESFKVWGSDASGTRRSPDAIFAGLFSGHETIGKVVIISEDRDPGANTLTPTKTCSNFRTSSGAKQMETWLKHYISPIHVLAMQALCGYETIIRSSSRFHGIFTPEEWLSFEY
ncbi:unnamed protein product [Rotaria socialis]|uniref:Uncharacterized protein n=1 Tax=Rotaria socialis TaxID=392032 RepID=A0A818S5V8_9BILA|nr:unnamed protein product [Rotaria socialis]CAF4869356.1 unnamed protein product [Rotaria socialis]